MKKRLSLLLCLSLILTLLTGCSGGKLDFSWFTSKFTGKSAEDTTAKVSTIAAFSHFYMSRCSLSAAGASMSPLSWLKAMTSLTTA